MKVLHSDNAPKALGPYSQAIEVNGFVFTSGQIPIDPKLSAASDSGNIELFEGNWLDPLSAVFDEMMK